MSSYGGWLSSPPFSGTFKCYVYMYLSLYIYILYTFVYNVMWQHDAVVHALSCQCAHTDVLSQCLQLGRLVLNSKNVPSSMASCP